MPSEDVNLAYETITAVRKRLERLLREEAERIAGPKPHIDQVPGHYYLVDLCVGKGTDFYDIGKWYKHCVQHKQRSCSTAKFLNHRALTPEQRARVEELWVRYSQTHMMYGKYYPPPILLSTLYLSSQFSGNPEHIGTTQPVAGPSGSQKPALKGKRKAEVKLEDLDMGDFALPPVKKRKKELTFTKPIGDAFTLNRDGELVVDMGTLEFH